MRATLFVCNIAAVVASFLLAGCASAPPGADLGPGVRAGIARTFHARHDFTVEVPEGAGTLRAWFAMPNRNDRMQDVSAWTVESPYPTRIVEDNHGNNFLYLEAQQPPAGAFDVKTRFTIRRSEVKATVDPARSRPHAASELAQLAPYLEDSSQSVADESIRIMAATAVGDERNPVAAARKLYDAVLERVDYHVKDPKSDAEKTMNSTGTGSSIACFETCTGNCTDFHSLYAAAARSVGIPTRAVYGSFFKGPLAGTDSDQSYHCWIEFHAPEIGWIPLDVAVADIFVADFVANENSRPRAHLTVANGYDGPHGDAVDYYFGNIDARRVTWHWGRDLVMNPPQQGEPLLWNPKAYVEIDGAQGKVSRKLTFDEVR